MKFQFHMFQLIYIFCCLSSRNRASKMSAAIHICVNPGHWAELPYVKFDKACNSNGYMPIHIKKFKFNGWTMSASFSFCAFRCYLVCCNYGYILAAVAKTFLISQATEPEPVAMDNSGFFNQLSITVLKLSKS